MNWVEFIGHSFFFILPWISGIWKNSIERKAIAQKNIVSILLKQTLCLFLFFLRQILPPVLEQGRFGEQFIGLFLFGRLLLLLGCCFRFFFLLWFLFGWWLFCSFSAFLSFLFQRFLDGILLFLKSCEYIVWTNVRDQE